MSLASDISAVAAAVDESGPPYVALSDRIWAAPEVRWNEHGSVRAQVEVAEDEGFRVVRDMAGIPTAFMAEAGSGGPVIALIGEYDALAGMSQAAGVPARRPSPEGGNGHGCGHHLLGTGSLLAAVAVKRELERRGLPGTVRYYGCPAEEAAAGKTYMVRDGAFADVDAALTWHPSDVTWVMRLDTLAYFQVLFRFRGEAAHAAAAPHLGRSALDAAELMNVGVNFLREHVAPEARVHYAFLETGGTAPNVVQADALTYYLVRERSVGRARELLARVEQVARGAALMTGTDVSIELEGGSSELLANDALEALLQQHLDALGGVPFDEQDAVVAERYAATLPPGTVASARRNAALALESSAWLHAETLPARARRLDFSSTDVGDVSWVVPTAQLEVACFALGCPPHSWQWVAQGTLSAAHKGMAHAAKVLGATALCLIEEPAALAGVRREHAERIAAMPYDQPLPADLIAPPLRS